MSFVKHAAVSVNARPNYTRNRSMRQAEQPGAEQSIPMQDYMLLQFQLDEALNSKRELKSKIMLKVGLVDVEADAVNVSDSELIDALSMLV